MPTKTEPALTTLPEAMWPLVHFKTHGPQDDTIFLRTMGEACR